MVHLTFRRSSWPYLSATDSGHQQLFIVSFSLLHYLYGEHCYVVDQHEAITVKYHIVL